MGKKELGYFIAGFVEGEGCFCININKRKDLKLGYEVRPTFNISQHKESKNVLRAIKKTLDINETIKIYRPKIRHILSLSCQNIKTLHNIIIPFFEKYKLLGAKRTNFDIWKKIVKMKYEKKIETKSQLRKVIKLRSKLNIRGKKKHFPNEK